ncbi:hypothetical protein F5B19DRAFT_489411 [Rostrohypoxylon terebratum]|nr:hypothetical protein F5B19DRAFT_489411 [Rostrohypoxylon terebratum]
MAAQPKFQITPSSSEDLYEEYIDRAVQVSTPTFRDDPVFTWLFHNHPPSKYQTLLSVLSRSFFLQASLNGVIFIEVNSFSCSGVLMPSEAILDNPRTKADSQLFHHRSSTLKGTSCYPIYLPSTGGYATKKKHRYTFIMGTAVHRRRQGFASALLVHMQERTRSDGWPLRLEAATPNSRNIYSKHGFITAGGMVLGKGKANPEGKGRKRNNDMGDVLTTLKLRTRRRLYLMAIS